MITNELECHLSIYSGKNDPFCNFFSFTCYFACLGTIVDRCINLLNCSVKIVKVSFIIVLPNDDDDDNNNNNNNNNNNGIEKKIIENTQEILSCIN